MTRENKLALVVGFGLMLLVGILVSDHFSTARGQEAASLARIIDPLADVREPADLVALREPTVGASPSSPAPPVRVVDPLVDPTPSIEMGAAVRPVSTAAGATPDRADATQRPGDEAFHDVRSGESLARICDRLYGDATLATALAAFNGIDDPNLVPEGRRLRIPDASVLIRRGDVVVQTATPTVRPAAADAAKTATYTVVSGDSLSEIALRLLGSGRRWPAIFEANRDKLDSPDDITVGMTLRIPS